MDSDDEALLHQLEQNLANKEWHASVMSRSYSDCQMRLYEEEESKDWNKMIFKLREDDKSQIDWKQDWSAIYRFDRFLNSVQGFHSGSLDLTGRHRSRYQELYSQWSRFLGDILEMLQSSAEEKVPIAGLDNEPIHPPDDREPTVINEDTTSPSEVYDRFRETWKLQSIPSELVFRRTSEALQYISKYPKPLFQVLLLQDLPTELIHQIMEVAGLDGSRLLGSTSRYFRQIALSYVYKGRSFDLPFNLDWRLYKTKSETEKRQYLEAEAHRSRDVLIEELDFVLSRPDIISSLLQVGMFSYRYDDARELLDFDHGSQDHLDFFGPIDMRVNALLQKTTNVRSLYLGFFTITEDIARAAMSLRSPRDITVSFCDLIGDGSLPQCPTVVNATFIMGSTHVSSWKFVKSWTNLRFLHIRCASGQRGIGPGPEFRATCNPFRALERLILERVEWEDLEEIDMWLRAAPELKLTHFKVEAGTSGMLQSDLARILVSLTGAPIRVLILDGLHCVSLDLFEAIAYHFPDIVSLSLSYRESVRQTRTCDAIWPLPSWKYAPVFQQFHHLVFFGWNFRIEMMETSPSQTLLSFEEGFETCWRPRDESLADWGSVARVLAAYCPTLKHVAFHHSLKDCIISRSQNGNIIVSTETAYTTYRGDNDPDIGDSWKV